MVLGAMSYERCHYERWYCERWSCGRWSCEWYPSRPTILSHLIVLCSHYAVLPCIVLYCIIVDNCFRLSSAEMCLHEYHLFGTLEHTTAAVKLSLLLVMLIFNVSQLLELFNGKLSDL